MTSWQLLSVLLQYPDPELVGAQAELAEAAAGSTRLDGFLAYLRSTPIQELQAAYVQTFDFDRRASLYLTYHTHGDRRQRGLELVRVKRRYAEAGLSATDGELPDYLPVLLEFTALAPQEGKALLNELRVPLELIRGRLHEERSPYAALLDALVAALPRPTKAQIDAARRRAEEGPPAELVGLEPFAAEVPA